MPIQLIYEPHVVVEPLHPDLFSPLPKSLSYSSSYASLTTMSSSVTQSSLSDPLSTSPAPTTISLPAISSSLPNTHCLPRPAPQRSSTTNSRYAKSSWKHSRPPKTSTTRRYRQPQLTTPPQGPIRTPQIAATSPISPLFQPSSLLLSSPDHYPPFPRHPEDIKESKPERSSLSLSFSENMISGIGSLFQSSTRPTVTATSPTTAQESLQAIWSSDQRKLMRSPSPTNDMPSSKDKPKGTSRETKRSFWFSDKVEENAIDEDDPETEDDEYDLRKLIRQSLAVRQRSGASTPTPIPQPYRLTSPQWSCPPPPRPNHILQPQAVYHPPRSSQRVYPQNPRRGSADLSFASKPNASKATTRSRPPTPMSPLSPHGPQRPASRRAGRPVIFEHVAEMNALEQAEDDAAPDQGWFRPGLLRRWTITSS